MTVLIEDLQVLLTTLAPTGGVWYQVNTAEPAVYPYIVFQRVSGTPNVSLDGPSDMQNTRIQIDIFARQIAHAAALETSLEALMAASSISNVPLGSQDLYEDAVKAYRVAKDFSVWSTN